LHVWKCWREYQQRRCMDHRKPTLENAEGVNDRFLDENVMIQNMSCVDYTAGI
jgi:hypothetical protein